MENSTTFRTATLEPSKEQEMGLHQPQKVELKDDGFQEEALSTELEIAKESELEKWEIQHGKYGLKYLGITEIAKEFPANAQFSVVDKFIKNELKSRGYDNTPQRYQDILQEIENEIGSNKLDAYERLKKLHNYIKVLEKFNKAKALKEAYR